MVLMALVRRPWAPRAAMKAKARMIPPMLAATPAKAATALRSQRGRCKRATTRARTVPMTPPITAVTADSWSESTK